MFKSLTASSLTIIMLLNCLFMASTYAFIAVASPIARLLNLEAWQMGMVISVVGIVWVVSAKFWGKQADKFGRIHTLRYALFGFSIFCTLLAVYIWWALALINRTNGIQIPPVWLSLSVLLMIRIIIGAFAAGIPISINAWVADNFIKNQRAPILAKINGLGAIGMIVAPPLAGLISQYSLSLTFLIFAILPLLLLPILYRLKDKPKRNYSLDTVSLSIQDPRIIRVWIASFVLFSSIIIINECLGFYLIDELHLLPVHAATWIGRILGLAGLSFIIAQLFINLLKDIAAKTWLSSGIFISAIGFIFPIFANQPLTVLIGYMIAGFGMGLAIPSASALAMNAVKDEEQGACASSMAIAQGAALIFAPIVGTSLYDLYYALPFALIVLMLSLIFFTIKFSSKQHDWHVKNKRPLV